jgi:cell division protein FtsQ
MTMLDIDPRIEARRLEVQREFSRRRFRILVAIAIVVVLTVGTYLTIESPFLDVDHVDVSGAVHLTPEQVRAAAAIEPGRALLRVDLGAVARRVEQLPWVADARVRRDLPGTLRIDVVEAKAVGYVQAHGAIAVVGPGDHVIATAHAVPAGAIEITGVRRVPVRGQLLSPAGTARVIEAIPAALRPHVRAVALRPATIAVVLDIGELRLCNGQQLAAKYDAALAVLQTYNGAPFDYIDVCVPADPVSRP